jgi:hypothetical protein
MFETITWRIRSGVAAATLGAVVLAVIAGCSSGGRAADTVAVVPASPSSSVAMVDAPTVPVVLEFGDHAVAATLSGTPASRDFVAMLPVTLVLSDTWRQAKSGRLSRPIRADGAVWGSKPAPGGIYYWPDPATLAVYYNDLGQSVPPPGLIRLGAVDTGLEQIADAGRQFTVRIDRAAGTCH